jgi:hypothetical protein
VAGRRARDGARLDKATRIGARIAVNGSIPVKLSDYNIQSPNAGAMGGLSNCDIDLLIAFDRAG